MQKPFKTTLSNGLRVILLEQTAAPVVSLNLWANVGSANETDEEAGLCHLIEHMLFKGTGRRPVGQIAREVEAAGGDMNAYTSFDETVFYINMPSKRLEVGLDILADAASDPTFDTEELAREKEVVVEEISRSEDNPSQMVSQDLFGKAYTLHPYRRPIAGDRETVRGVPREHLIQFFRKWYVGPNLIFIGVGNFKNEEIFLTIDRLFSKIGSGIPPSQSLPEEPAPKEPRIITRNMAIEGRYMDLSFPIPSLTHPDIPALDLLGHILGGGASSRLEQRLKEEKKLVSAISSAAFSPRHPGLFIVGALLNGKKIPETVRGIREETLRLQSDPPSIVEFARARETIRSARIYERQTVESMARKLGYFEGIAGDLNFEEEYFRKLADVTPEEIRKTAQTYLAPERITLSICHPKGESWAEETLRSVWVSPEKTPKVPRRPRRNGLVSGTFLFRLSSGIRLLVRENPYLPLLSIRSASLGGLRAETAGTNGISHLISLLLTKGTALRSGRELAEETENLSGHLDGYTGRNLLGLQGTFLSEKIAEGFDLFFDCLRNPSFPAEEILKEKEHTYTTIRSEEDSLPSVAMRKFLRTLYPRHPYGFPTLGTIASVKSLNRNRIARCYQALVRPENLVLSVVGDVSAADVRNRIEEKTRGWKSPRAGLLRLKDPTPPIKPLCVETHRKKLQAHIIYGFLGTTLRNPDRYPLEVLNSVLAGQGGRLFLELRDKQGLAYAVSSSTHEGVERGFFAVYMGTDPSKLPQAIEGIQKELFRVREEPVAAEEIERAKRFIVGNYELDLQKNNTVASLLAYDEIYGLGREELTRYPEEIEAVTQQDILRVAKKYIRPDASVLSVIKP